MLSKTRTTIIALATVFSFAGASLVPAVSQADQKSKEAQKTKECDGLWGIFEASVNRMDKALGEGNSAAFDDAKRTAENAMTLAEGSGCDWASRVRPPTQSYPAAGLTATPQGSLQGGGGSSPTPILAVTATSSRLLAR